MEQLNHQTGEPLEGTRNANGRADLNEDTFGGVNVYLQLAGLVDGRVQEREEALHHCQQDETELAMWVGTW